VLVSLAAVLALLILTGCGYALVGRASNLPEDVRDVYIEPLRNDTPRSQIEQILTQAITDEMLTRRRFNLVNDAASADAVLKGAVVSLSTRSLEFDTDGLASNLEVTITANMTFQRVPSGGQEEGEVLWSNARYVFRQSYEVLGGGLDYQNRENIALEEVSDRFARTLVTDLLEGF
jgi:outer membrane lipopolysaccharide assembly protein LptE/RlpB